MALLPGSKRLQERETASSAREEKWPEHMDLSNRGTRPLEIVHMDICGPMREESPGVSAYLQSKLNKTMHMEPPKQLKTISETTVTDTGRTKI